MPHTDMTRTSIVVANSFIPSSLARTIGFVGWTVHAGLYIESSSALGAGEPGAGAVPSVDHHHLELVVVTVGAFLFASTILGVEVERVRLIVPGAFRVAHEMIIVCLLRSVHLVVMKVFDRPYLVGDGLFAPAANLFFAYLYLFF